MITPIGPYLRGEAVLAPGCALGADLEMHVHGPAGVIPRVDRDELRRASRIGELVAAQELLPGGRGAGSETACAWAIPGLQINPTLFVIAGSGMLGRPRNDPVNSNDSEL
jgi:hypothetical protein